MFDLEHFGLREMIESSRALRQLAERSTSMEGAAREIVDFLMDAFRVGGTGAPASVLVRCFKTHRFGELPPDLREVATGAMHGAAPDPATLCLTLLATRGMRPEWNSRHTSTAHRAIPLATPEMVAHAPMIARLVQQMGLEPADVVAAPKETLWALERRTLDVFHIEDARGSAFVPAQKDFVEPCGVRSVLGFGGLLPSAELFAILLFTTVHIEHETAELFRNLGLAAKLVLLRHAGRRVFDV